MKREENKSYLYKFQEFYFKIQVNLGYLQIPAILSMCIAAQAKEVGINCISVMFSISL